MWILWISHLTVFISIPSVLLWEAVIAEIDKSPLQPQVWGSNVGISAVCTEHTEEVKWAQRKAGGEKNPNQQEPKGFYFIA